MTATTTTTLDLPLPSVWDNPSYSMVCNLSMEKYWGKRVIPLEVQALAALAAESKTGYISISPKEQWPPLRETFHTNLEYRDHRVIEVGVTSGGQNWEVRLLRQSVISNDFSYEETYQLLTEPLPILVLPTNATIGKEKKEVYVRYEGELPDGEWPHPFLEQLDGVPRRIWSRWGKELSPSLTVRANYLEFCSMFV